MAGRARLRCLARVPGRRIHDLVAVVRPATIARATGLDPDHVAIFFPPLLGALYSLALFALLVRLCSVRGAVVGVALSLVLPELVLLSALGRLDHHIAEILAQLAAYAIFCRLIERADEHVARDVNARGLGGAAAPAWTLGLVMGAALLTWAGSLLFLCVPTFVAAALALRGEPRGAIVARAHALAMACAGACVLPYAVLNLERGRPAFASVHLSMLHVLACAVLALGPLLAAWLRSGLSEGAPGKVFARIAAVLAVALLPLAHPGFRHGLLDGLLFVTRGQSAWLTQISQFAPVLSSDAAYAATLAFVGYGLHAQPLVALVLGWALARSSFRDARLWVALAWVLHGLVLALAQLRFVAYAAGPIAAAPALVWHVSNGAGLGARGRGALRVLSFVLALTVAPALKFWLPALGLGQRPHVAYPQLELPLLGFLDAVNKVTPPAGDPADPSQRPSYAIMAPWDLGHWLLVISERAVVATPFGAHLAGGGYEDSVRLYDSMGTEREVDALLARRGCRYLITQAPAPDDIAATRSRPRVFVRGLHERDGSDGAAASGSGHFALRLEMAVPGQLGGALYKLFERVEGANVRFEGAAGLAISLATVRHGAGRDFTYARNALPRASNAELRVAYPGLYQVLADGRPIGQLRVARAAVERGLTVSVPLTAATP